MLHLNCTPTIRSVREALLGDDIDDEHAESLDAFALRFRPISVLDDPETGRHERGTSLSGAAGDSNRSRGGVARE